MASKSIPWLIALLGLEIVALSAPASAATSAVTSSGCAAPSEECLPIGQWSFRVALGAGVRTNPLVSGKDLPLVVIPQISYYGKRFFLDNLDLGFTLIETDSNTVSLIASPGYDRLFFYRSDLQNIFVGGLPTSESTAPEGKRTAFPPRRRNITYLAGPEWTFKYGIVSAQLDVLHEITGQNEGNEIRAALGVPLIESKGALTADVGLTWKSAAIVNYYYGAPNIYQGGSALDPFLKLGYSRPLSRKWRLSAFAQYEYLASAVGHSPIVAEHYVVTVFIGAIYAF